MTGKQKKRILSLASRLEREGSEDDADLLRSIASAREEGRKENGEHEDSEKEKDKGLSEEELDLLESKMSHDDDD